MAEQVVDLVRRDPNELNAHVKVRKNNVLYTADKN